MADQQVLLLCDWLPPALQGNTCVLADVNSKAVLRGVLQRTLRALEILWWSYLFQTVLQNVSTISASVKESDVADRAIVRGIVLVLDGPVGWECCVQGKSKSTLSTFVGLGWNFTPLHWRDRWHRHGSLLHLAQLIYCLWLWQGLSSCWFHCRVASTFCKL